MDADAALLALPLLAATSYLPVLMVEILVAVLFAASLHFLMGPGGMLSFGHAAYFGLGAYAAALVTLKLQWPMPAAMATGALAAMPGACCSAGSACACRACTWPC
jgi:branched-chain amino acid transport system permease protein